MSILSPFAFKQTNNEPHAPLDGNNTGKQFSYQTSLRKFPMMNHVWGLGPNSLVHKGLYAKYLPLPRISDKWRRKSNGKLFVLCDNFCQVWHLTHPLLETSQMPQGSADERENGGNHNRLTTKMLYIYQAGLRFMGTKLA
jgi:hypothetical protein